MSSTAKNPLVLFALDLETTGLNPAEHEVLSIGCVAFTPRGIILGRYETAVHWKSVTGDPYALHMNAELLKRIATQDPPPPDYDAAVQGLNDFFQVHLPSRGGKPVVVGFRVGVFDVAFLEQSYPWHRFSTRSIDLGTYLMPLMGYDRMVGSAEAHEYFGRGPVAHTALADAEEAAHIYIEARRRYHELGCPRPLQENS